MVFLIMTVSKLIFSTVNSTLTGAQLYDILLERYHIQMEMETETYALALAAVGDREEGFETSLSKVF